MKAQKVKDVWILMALLTALLFIFPDPGRVQGAEFPSPEDVVARNAKCPTIEDLTNGKIKKGNIIDANNMELVKEYLSPGVAEAVSQGMVLIMGTQLSPDQGIPKSLIEATIKNSGKAILDKNGVVYYEKEGTLWPGGIPFPEPKNGLEVMANKKYGGGADDYSFNATILFVNAEGKRYKKTILELLYMWCNTRTTLPPLGTIPGYEDVMYKRISVMTYPLEVKGLGQYTVRYYDDAKQYDSGFAYFPAFKRTMRISATTWQDNVGGSDFTFGDGNGFQEPYSYWDFTLIGTRYILVPEPSSPFPLVDSKGKINEKLQFDVGDKFPRVGWAVSPIHIVEALPKIKHVYGKKTIYILSAPYWNPDGQIQLVENYDRQMKMWKLYVSLNGDYNEKMHYYMMYGVFINDLMSGHMTQYWYKINMNQGLEPENISMKRLISKGR